MSKVREELKPTNQYYVSKYRRKELKYYCLQYYEWVSYLKNINFEGNSDEWSDPTGNEAVKREMIQKQIDQIDRLSIIAGGDIGRFIKMSVTENLSYKDMCGSKYNIPCSRDYFYSRYHKFWFILSQEKHMF